jgi:hypothetical protein
MLSNCAVVIVNDSAIMWGLGGLVLVVMFQMFMQSWRR